MDSNLTTLRQSVFDYCRLMLGDGMMDVEADPVHYQNALSRSIEIYRAKSSYAVEEMALFLELQENTQEYTLPLEVQAVTKLFRRAIGDFNHGDQIEPFSQATVSTMLLNAGRTGGLVSYELFKNYQFQLDRMFGGQLDFNFNSVTKKLTIFRRPTGSGESILIQCYAYVPEEQLLVSPYSLWFIKDYTYAIILETIGQAREKYSSVASATGGTTLNGAQLKSQASEMKKSLEEALKTYLAPMGIFMG